jgi:predicted CXXCH cytochrome family protein
MGGPCRAPRVQWRDPMTNRDGKTSAVIALLTCAFCALTVRFATVPPRPAREYLPPIVPRDHLAVIPGGTVRTSVAQLIASGGDTSVLDCYSCHHKESPPEVKAGPDGRIVLPKEHADLIFAMRNCAECHPPSDPVKIQYDDNGALVMPKAHARLLMMAHGRNFRNENCYNCHDRDQLDQLHSADGAKLKFEQATLLCAGCHGTTYRDWQAGVHGRTSGYWDRKAGPIKREQCASCHDPHAPAFTGIIPMPGPHPLHPPQAAPAADSAPENHGP